MLWPFFLNIWGSNPLSLYHLKVVLWHIIRSYLSGKHFGKFNLWRRRCCNNFCAKMSSPYSPRRYNYHEYDYPSWGYIILYLVVITGTYQSLWYIHEKSSGFFFLLKLILSKKGNLTETIACSELLENLFIVKKINKEIYWIGRKLKNVTLYTSIHEVSVITKFT